MTDSRLTQSLTNSFKDLLAQGLQPIQDKLDELQRKKNLRNEEQIDDKYFLRHESDDPDYCLQNEEDAHELIDFIIKKNLNFSDKSSNLNLKLNRCGSFVALRYLINLINY